MDNLLWQWWNEIATRPSGPMALRFYLQPLMAALLAIRDGVRDARAGHPPYFWRIFTVPAARRELVRHGWRSVGKVFVIAWVLDTVYQLAVLKGVRPMEGLFVAALLSIVPYLFLRGPANRIARRIERGGARRNRSARA